jgi:hypothetical protein
MMKSSGEKIGFLQRTPAFHETKYINRGGSQSLPGLCILFICLLIGEILYIKESASISPARVTSGCNCKMEAGTLGVMGPQNAL